MINISYLLGQSLIILALTLITPFVAFKRIEVKESLSDYLTRAYPDSNLLELIITESEKERDIFLNLSLPEQYYYSLYVVNDSDCHFFEDDMIKDEYEMNYKD